MLNRIKYHYKKLFWSPEKKARNAGATIGVNCNIQSQYFGSEPYLVSIGDNVQVTTGVKFFTHGGGWVFRDKDPEFDTFGKIVVKNNVYIGNNALLLPGVTIGNNVIIGSGSIVTKSVKDNSIVAGNPAKVIGNVEELYEKLQKYNLNTKSMNSRDKKAYLLSLEDSYFIKK